MKFIHFIKQCLFMPDWCETLVRIWNIAVSKKDKDFSPPRAPSLTRVERQ